MLRHLSFLLLLGSFSFLHADVLVLKNGKKVTIDGSYEVKGEYVVFKSTRGDIHQLPLKMVDLEGSEKATTAYHAAQAAKKAALEAEPEPVRETSISMAEIAERVEAKRNRELAPPRIRLENEKLESYSNENPRPSNDAVEVVPFESDITPEKVDEKRRQFHDSYQKLQKEIEELDSRIEETQAVADAFANESAYGNDAGGSAFEAMERMDKRIEELRKTRAEKEDQMKELHTQARRSGIKNYKNMRPARKQSQ